MKIPDETKEKVKRIIKSYAQTILSPANICFMLDPNYYKREKLVLLLHDYEIELEKIRYCKEITEEQIRWLDLEDLLDS